MFMEPYTPRPLPEVSDETLNEYPPLLRTLLLVRGIATSEDAHRFLVPNWERDTHDSFLLKDMRRGVERIVRAMNTGEMIAVWSDYDMDGIPGAVLLVDLFRALEYPHVVHHTPHRNKDGFGLNHDGLDSLFASGVALVITIDCGIGDVEQVAYANTLGLEVIVTDHHIPGETLPPAYAVINPKQTDCAYPEKMLCGAGVAFKLAQALLAHLRHVHAEAHVGEYASTCTIPPHGWEKWLLDMAGMATIADMVPLVGENRTFAHFGLTVLRKSRRPGLQALLRQARVDQRFLVEDDIGFTIAPRINAASRMGHARDAFQLLVTRDVEEAGVLAGELDRINKERKVLVATMKREIHTRIHKRGALKHVVVMGHPDWKPSLLGLVASGLAEEYARPVFLWGREEGITIKGSCRSGGGVNVYEVMHHARESFLEYGGHAYSGGFSVSETGVHTLEDALVEAYARVAPRDEAQKQYADGILALTEVTWDTYHAVARLGPFGEGNPKPLFILRDVVPHTVRTFGKGNEHLEVIFTRDDGSEVKAIAFFKTPQAYPALVRETPCTLVAHLESSHFRGKSELRLRIVSVW